MKQRLFRGTVTPLILGLFTSLVIGQASSYLAQKLMLENDLRKRIADALEKVIENRKYVVDVSVDLELSSAVEQQTTFKTGAEAKQGLTGQELKPLDETTGMIGEPVIGGRTSVGLPIPGFDFEVGESTAEKETVPLEEGVSKTPEKATPAQNNILSKSYTERYPSVSRLKRMEISIILQEGAAPELIENIRQVVMVASGFNRTRGDVMSIMTASFKKRRDEKTAEQVLLKNIAEKLESLETQRAKLGEVDWRQELENYKQQEAERRKEDQLYFQSKLAELEGAARDRAYETAKRDILKQDSIRLQALDEEIQNLKTFLGAGAAPDSTKAKVQSSVQDKLQQKASLDAQIAQKLTKLESVQNELDRQYRDGSDNTTMVVFVSILGALVIVLIVVLVFVLMNRTKQSVVPPPPWMYPPRRKKKSKEAEGSTATPVKPAAPPPPEPVEDIAVLQSEVNDMKQAVVSMSVGQPKAATKIVKEWIQEAPPPPPEPATPAAEPEEPKSGKKKKKK
ncbi:MAG: flagellar M-ring protein FliF C-terminal domain-containing protein [Fidelibacterota bacterium]